VDFAGFSGETLHGVIQEPLDKIRIGQLRPESLSIRILVPDAREPYWPRATRTGVDLARSKPRPRVKRTSKQPLTPGQDRPAGIGTHRGHASYHRLWA
jgi:hypothetical protein